MAVWRKFGGWVKGVAGRAVPERFARLYLDGCGLAVSQADTEFAAAQAIERLRTVGNETRMLQLHPGHA